jgi:hypothetical protein
MMRRIVLPATEVGIGGETIAKNLFCPEVTEPDGVAEFRRPSPLGIPPRRRMRHRAPPGAVVKPRARHASTIYPVVSSQLSVRREIFRDHLRSDLDSSFGRAITLEVRKSAMAMTARPRFWPSAHMDFTREGRYCLVISMEIAWGFGRALLMTRRGLLFPSRENRMG